MSDNVTIYICAEALDIDFLDNECGIVMRSLAKSAAKLQKSHLGHWHMLIPSPTGVKGEWAQVDTTIARKLSIRTVKDEHCLEYCWKLELSTEQYSNMLRYIFNNASKNMSSPTQQLIQAIFAGSGLGNKDYQGSVVTPYYKVSKYDWQCSAALINILKFGLGSTDYTLCPDLRDEPATIAAHKYAIGVMDERYSRVDKSEVYLLRDYSLSLNVK